MLKFRPIVYADADLRAFKYIGAATQEGRLCSLSAGSTNLSIIAATPFSGTAPATLFPGTAGNAGATLFDSKAYFPIYRENPDPENVTPTINQNDFVVGFAMKSGNAFEVHKTMTESGFASTFAAVGGLVCLGSTGKIAYRATKNATALVIGRCLGTFNATWIRVEAI